MNARWIVSSRATLWAIVALVVLAGCSAAPNVEDLPTLSPSLPNAQRPKRLATVYISPTPNAAEQQATRLAMPPTANPFATPEPTLTPTVYVGLFLGDSARTMPQVNDTDLLGMAPPTITVIAPRCTLNADTDILGTRWQSSPLVTRGLGCAIEGLVPFGGTMQVFDNGAMYAADTDTLWAIRVGEAGRYWTLEGRPDVETVELVAPPGYLPPSGSFNAMWQGVDGVRDALGWAQTAEIRVDMAYQRFEGGTLFYDGETGQVYALLIDGSAYGPF